jgi:hypothetical protein
VCSGERVHELLRNRYTVLLGVGDEVLVVRSDKMRPVRTSVGIVTYDLHYQLAGVTLAVLHGKTVQVLDDGNKAVVLLGRLIH